MKRNQYRNSLNKITDVKIHLAISPILHIVYFSVYFIILHITNIPLDEWSIKSKQKQQTVNQINNSRRPAMKTATYHSDSQRSLFDRYGCMVGD